MYGSKSAKFQLCITAQRIIIFRRTALGHICSLFSSFSKSGRRNNSKSAFQYTVNNNTTYPYLFTYKPTLAISRVPKLVRHDSRRNLSEKNRKNISYKPRPRFLHKKLLEHSFKKPSLSGNSHVESYCVE